MRPAPLSYPPANLSPAFAVRPDNTADLATTAISQDKLVLVLALHFARQGRVAIRSYISSLDSEGRPDTIFR
jgi:hypothetical protein